MEGKEEETFKILGLYFLLCYQITMATISQWVRGNVVGFLASELSAALWSYRATKSRG